MKRQLSIMSFVVIILLAVVSFGALKKNIDPDQELLESQQNETKSVHKKFFARLFSELEKNKSPSPMLGMRPAMVLGEFHLYGLRVTNSGEEREEFIGSVRREELTFANCEAKADKIVHGITEFYDKYNVAELLATPEMFVKFNEPQVAIHERLQSISNIVSSTHKDALLADDRVRNMGAKFLIVDGKEHAFFLISLDEDGAHNEYFIDRMETQTFNALSDKELEIVLLKFFEDAHALVDKIFE